MRWRAAAGAQWWRGALWVCAVALSGSAAASDLVLEDVTVFKNGVSVVSYRGVIPDSELEVELGALPVPALGSVAVTADASVALAALVGVEQEVEESRSIRSFAELVEANMGRRVTLHLDLGAGGGTEIWGDLLAWTTEEESEGTAEAPGGAYLQNPLAATQREVVMVATADGIEAVPLTSIERMSGEDLEQNLTRTRREKGLRLHLEKPARGATYRLRYLTKGLAWFPAYVFDVSNEKTLGVRASAEVVNELADLEDVQLELVVGSPNVRFADIDSPLGRSEDLASLFASIDRGFSGDDYRSDGRVGQQAVFLNQAAVASVSPNRYRIPSEGQTEDLFFHRVEGFSLDEDAAAWVELGRADLPYRHVYRWEVADQLAESVRDSEVVWHSIRLRNTASWPLTTGPVLFEKDGRVIGQSRVTYTASGNEAVVGITRALDIPVRQQEVEVARERIEERIQGDYYNRITLEGTLVVRNQMSRPAEIEVEKLLRGELESASGGPKVDALAEGFTRVNPRHRLEWELELEPGETVEISYRYHALVER